MKLLGKLLITGHIEALTGLAIGGSKSDVAIGGIDNNVIKNSEGVPYIPGSSLKGKLRSLIEKRFEREEVCSCGKEDCVICTVFGTGLPTKNKNITAGPTRLYVRDAKLNENTKKQMEKKEGIFSNLELTYTEGKWENQINRLTSKAAHPRQQERVPAGSIFDFNMIYNILTKKDIEYFHQVITALRLLEDDYLGGNGSRGYGRIQFQNVSILLKTVSDYESGGTGKEIFSGLLSDFEDEEAKNKLKSLVEEEEKA
ncbi:type III-A CRISPR-associated RAMP protein Csm3 [Aeribacillus composti]|uniref:type III-A CRISPR-associated RAMP protein Csm3 n=1 Tax=Aeribacillus composti TaxID=1868734 RepID=UPI002E23B45E|nr:type III-A CRISPR-associated RAMP protein Csm3 [Aeribacillus composti]